MSSQKLLSSLQIIFIIIISRQIECAEDGYLRLVKDGCFLRGEAFSCVKYKALKLAKNALFGDSLHSNDTIKANNVISFVPLDTETINQLNLGDKSEVLTSEPKGILSEWAQLAKYFMKVMKDFFKVKGLRVNLPEGARTIEDDSDDDARGKKKKLAIVVPLLTLLTAFKTKLLLIPVLLSVLLVKKLLLVAALLLPSLLNTLKACKQHHHPSHYSYFGSSDSSDFNSDYGNYYASGSGYNKDWASNRAYSMQKHRPTQAPVYITAPGAV